MKNLKNTQGSVWLAVLVIIAVVVAALLLSGNLGFMSNNAIEGRVEQVNHEESFIVISHIEVLSVAENGDAEIKETQYVAMWNDEIEAEIAPDLPSSLQIGQMVSVVPSERLEENQTMFVIGELDILREADLEEIEDSTQEESPVPTTSTTSSQ